MEADSPLNGQMDHFPAWFQPAASAVNYVLYRVQPGIAATPLTDANTTLSQGDAAQAAAQFETVLAVAIRPGERCLAALGLGQARLALGQLDAARAAFQVAAEADEHDPWATFYLGQTAMLTGRPAEAAPSFQRATDLEPALGVAWQRLGDARQALGQADAALQAYQAVARQWNLPGTAGYEQALGTTLLNAGRYDEAITAYQRGLQILGDDGKLWLLIAQVQQSMGDQQAAELTLHDVARRHGWDASGPEAHAELGDLYSGLGEFERAEEEYRAALRLNPVGDYGALAQLWQSRQGTSAAITSLERLPGYQLSFMTALTAMANLQASAGQLDVAIAADEQALTRSRLSSGLMLQLAAHRLAQGEFDAAADQAQAALDLGGTYGAQMRLGDLAVQRGRLSEGIGHYWLAELAAPALAYPHLSLGSTYLQLGDVDRARAEYEMAGSRPLAIPVSLWTLGSFYQSRGETEAAQASFQQAINLQPAAAAAYSGRGGAYLAAGKLPEATQAISSAVEIAPATGPPRVALASVLVQQGRPEAALAQLEQAAVLDPGYASAGTALGDLYLRLDRPDDAEAAYKRTIGTLPNVGDGYMGLASLYERRGRTAEAEAVYRQGLDHVPTSLSSRLQVALGSFLLRRGRSDEAVASYKAAIAAQPALSDPYVQLSSLYSRQGRWADARQALEAGLAIVPGSASLIDALGDLEAATGNPLAALESYKRAAELTPSLSTPIASLVTLYAGQGNIDRALAELDAALQVWPGSYWLLISAASWQISPASQRQRWSPRARRWMWHLAWRAPGYRSAAPTGHSGGLTMRSRRTSRPPSVSRPTRQVGRRLARSSSPWGKPRTPRRATAGRLRPASQTRRLPSVWATRCAGRVVGTRRQRPTARQPERTPVNQPAFWRWVGCDASRVRRTKRALHSARRWPLFRETPWCTRRSRLWMSSSANWPRRKRLSSLRRSNCPGRRRRSMRSAISTPGGADGPTPRRPMAGRWPCRGARRRTMSHSATCTASLAGRPTPRRRTARPSPLSRETR